MLAPSATIFDALRDQMELKLERRGNAAVNFIGGRSGGQNARGQPREN